MKLLNLKKRKTLALYMMIGLLHSLLTMYVSIPFSSILLVPHTWNRNMWTVIAVIVAIIISLLEKKKLKENSYIWILLTAMLVTFITSFFCAVVVFIFTPSVEF